MAVSNHGNNSFSPFTFKMTDRVSLRVYGDSRPHFLEIAPLQKGLILIFDQSEIVEEGVGFGVPVVKYTENTYFSSNAEYSVKKEGDFTIILKTFLLDTIARKRIGENLYLNPNVYRALRKSFESQYLTKNNLRKSFNLLMQIRPLIGVKTDFVKVKPKGKVTVRYQLYENTIKIKASLIDLEKENCKEILLLNEQGANFFNKYSDSLGLKFVGDQIGAWEKVNAIKAYLSDKQEMLKFTLHKQRQATLFRGREQIKNRFSWSGLSYLLDAGLSEFNYVIELSEPVP